MKKAIPATARTPPPRKTYRTPVLVTFGDVRHLTGGGGGTRRDNSTGMRTRAGCWIAEVLYGVDAPRVILVRGWLAGCRDRREPWALVVVPLYARFGEHVAAVIRAFPFLGHLFRPLFDAGVRKAYRESCEVVAARKA